MRIDKLPRRRPSRGSEALLRAGCREVVATECQMHRLIDATPEGADRDRAEAAIIMRQAKGLRRAVGIRCGTPAAVTARLHAIAAIVPEIATMDPIDHPEICGHVTPEAVLLLAALLRDAA